MDQLWLAGWAQQPVQLYRTAPQSKSLPEHGRAAPNPKPEHTWGTQFVGFQKGPAASRGGLPDEMPRHSPCCASQLASGRLGEYAQLLADLGVEALAQVVE